jgi:hypothetical protein
MNSIAHFFEPYVLFLLGAAYNVQQTLEGLRLRSSSFLVQDADGNIVQSYWSPFEAAMFSLLVLLLYSLLLFGFLLVAAYILGRRRGIYTALLLLALPGFASTLGLWPRINYLPETFVIGGTGTLGSAWGMFPLVFMGLLTGWSVVVILSDLLDFKDKFRHYYDHLWYSMAILTCLFFVADSNTSQVAQEFQRGNLLARQASAYLLQQVRDYDLQCQEDPSIGTASCAWAADVQRKLSDYAMEDERHFPWRGPKSSAEIYDPFGQRPSPEQILAIRREIKTYNDSRCPVEVLGEGWFRPSRPSATCQRQPFIFCIAPHEPFDEQGEEEGPSWISRTVAMASECIIPSLVVWRVQQEKLEAVVADNARTKHFRWLFFILFSLVVGGKVANTTSRAMEFDKRPEQEKRRLLGLLRSGWLGAKNGVGLAIKVCRVVLGYACSGLHRVACAIRLGAKHGLGVVIKVCRVVLGYACSGLQRVASAIRKL